MLTKFDIKLSVISIMNLSYWYFKPNGYKSVLFIYFFNNFRSCELNHHIDKYFAYCEMVLVVHNIKKYSN